MSKRSVVSHLLTWAAAVSFALFAMMSPLLAQVSPSTAVPQLISYSGVLKDAGGRAVTGMSGVTFLIYKDEAGGSPLWLETQSVKADASGHYSVQLGAVNANGLPAEIFMTGEGRWLAVQIGSEPEQPRVLLVAVPYAMKAADAETLGGLPLSAFVLATPRAANAAPDTNAGQTNTPSALPPSAAVTGTGTVNAIPLWDSTSDIVSSVISQVGTGATTKIGINTTTPASTLDVKGGSTFRGVLALPAPAPATAAAGKTSQPLSFVGSSFNSATNAAVNQTFRLQAEPAANNTAANSGTLNLLYGSGTSVPAETGLKIASNGQITFAAGQTFPGGGGGGTITGVTAGSGLVGGGTSGVVSLSLPTTCALNQLLKWNGTTWICSADGNSGGTIKGVTAGTDLTGGGTTGVVTVNLDTTKVPQLNTANTFTGNQSVTGNFTATGTISGSVVNASVLDVGGNAIAFGSPASFNVFLGFAGGSANTGSVNTGVGVEALLLNTSGFANTATGSQAMISNKTGANNTAFGTEALGSNVDGFYNTAVGSLALLNTIGFYNTGVGLQTLENNTGGGYNVGFGYNAGPDASTPNLNNSAAIGSYADVTQSNSLVLGSIKGVNGAGADTLVGIGTTAPVAKLDVHGTGNFTGLVTFAAGQKFPGTGSGTITGVTAGTGLTGGGTTGGVTLNVDTTKVVTGVTAGTGLTGGGTGGVQTLNLDATKVPLLSNTNQFTSPNSFSSSGIGQPALSVSNFGVGDGIDVSSASNAAVSTTNSPFGVSAAGGNYPITGTQGLYEGVYGDSYTDVGFAAGIVGMEHGPTAATIGVFGESDSGGGWGVYGQDQATMSIIGSNYGLNSGVWGDGGSYSNGDPGVAVGVVATADDSSAILAYNSAGFATISAHNAAPNGAPFFAQNTANGSYCEVDPNGNLLCSGSKNAVVKIDGGARRVALAAIESPKNWFEDFGSAQLVNGVAVVALEADFAQTVNTETDYKVFPVPNGDCKGLYVTRKTATSFEVRELGGGTSSVTFDYRITALRKNYENIRLADHTNDPVLNGKTPKRITNPGRFDIKKLIPPTVTAKAASIHRSAERNTKP
jgi:hypothetical protein